MTNSDAGRRARQAVADLVTGSGLHVQEISGELVITNPRDPSKGQIHVEYSDGYVSWEHVTWAYWGTLEGFPDAGEDFIGAGKILETLLGRSLRRSP